MPLFEVEKLIRLTILVEANTPEEAKANAKATPEHDWDEAEEEPALTATEVEVPF